MSTRTEARLQDVERRMRALQHEVDEIRRLVAAEQAPEPRLEPTPGREPERAPEPVWVESEPPLKRHVPGPVPRTRPALDLDVGALLGPRALAWAGGLVTLLGIVFFFVLAVDRGWIGEGARVAMGATASAVAFGAGFWLRRRFGETYASLAAAGAGIAGGYATLLAAAALYGLVPAPVALVLAAAIAAAGAAAALRWNSELVAGLGLVGAIGVPAVVALDGSLTATGTGFAALVFAGAIAVAVVRRWPALLAAATVAALPQVAALVLDADGRHGRVLALAAVYSALLLAAGLAEHARRGRGALAGLPATYVLGGALLAGYASAILFDGTHEGFALAAVGAAYLALAAALFRLDRDLSALLGAVGLAVGGVTAAELASGTGLAVAWAAQAAVLAWLARRVDDDRYRLASLVYLLLAAFHVGAVDAPLHDLFTEVADPAHGIPALAAVALACAAVGGLARPRDGAVSSYSGIWAPFSRTLADLRTEHRRVAAAALALGSLAAVEAGSLGIVATVDGFDWAHVGVAALWGAVAASVVAAGALLRRSPLAVAGLSWAGATVALGWWDGEELAPPQAHWAWLAAGAGILAAATLYQALVSRHRLDPAAAPPAAVAAVGASIAWAELFSTGWTLALAALLAALAAVLRTRQRDYATLLAAVALADAVFGLVELLDGTWLVLALALGGAALALLGRRLAEPRLSAGSALVLAAALLHALALEAPVRDLFVAGPHPGGGAQALAIAAGGIAVLAWTLAGGQRQVSAWISATLPVYAASLAILELSIQAGDRGLDAAFQRGHTGVSALWGIVGTALIWVGVARRRTPLRLGGFALFGIALAKLFLYDLTSLSSITRAFSFLAVGAVLLAAGFLHQRLAGAARESGA